MSRIRIGVLDVSAIALLLIAVLLPGRNVGVGDGFSTRPGEDINTVRSEIAAAQAHALAGDRASLEELRDLLVAWGHHDQALRAMGTAAAEGDDDRWRAHLATSSVHASRIEIEQAYAYATRAAETCDAEPAACPAHERVRLRLYHEQLEAGMNAIASGADPRLEPDRFKAEMARVHPTARMRAAPGGE